MKRLGRALSIPLLLVALMSDVTAPTYGAFTPSLGLATTYGVLASTYINPMPGTTINGDVGFTTAPAIVPAGVHTNYGSAAPYARQQLTRQAHWLSSLPNHVHTLFLSVWLI